MLYIHFGIAVCANFFSYPVQGEVSSASSFMELNSSGFNNRPHSPNFEDLITFTKIKKFRLENEFLEKWKSLLLKETSLVEQQLNQGINSNRKQIALILYMADELKAFVDGDTPFKLVERKRSINELFVMLQSAKYTEAAKLDLIFKAFKKEVEFSYTMECYRDFVDLSDGKRELSQFLRIGRKILMYRSLDGHHLKVWLDGWQDAGEKYQQAFEDGAKSALNYPLNQPIVLPVKIAGFSI